MIPHYKCRNCNAIFPGDRIHSRVNAADYIKKKGHQQLTYHKCATIIGGGEKDRFTGVADMICIDGTNAPQLRRNPQTD